MFDDRQLRDLLSCPWKDRNDVLAVYHTSVAQYNPKDQTISYPLKDLSFSPTTVASGYGYLVVGGQRGQTVVRNLETQWTAQTAVTSTITNSVAICEHSGQTRLLISSNDESITVYTLPDLANVATVTFPTAVNSAAVSPDGTRMVAVGDTNQVFLFNVDSTGYHLEKTLTAGKDAAFSCAWNQSSTRFAVACQDGLVCLWDVRNMRRKLAKITNSQGSACRSVKFSQGGSIDLLAFTHHQSYIEIVDTRAFENRECIRVAPTDVDLNLTGLVFSPDNRSLFVGTEPALLEYHIDTQQRRGFPVGGILNLDGYTENYHIGFYANYLTRWPEYCVVAESLDGRLIGYVMGKSEGTGSNWHGHVTALTVAPAYRRLGIANRLMDHLESVSEGGKMFFVDLFVRSSNYQAIEMYRKLGYSVYRRVLDYYTGAMPEDGLDMRKALSRDTAKRSVIPLAHPVHADDLDY